MLSDPREEARIIRDHRWLWVVVAQFRLLLGLGEGGFDVLGPAVARRYSGGAGAYGALLAVRGDGSIGGALIAVPAPCPRQHPASPPSPQTTRPRSSRPESMPVSDR